MSNLIDLVLDQIKKDVAMGDLTAIEELIKDLSLSALEGFLKEDGKDIRLCPYHQDSLGWDDCTDGFENCQIEKLKEN